MTNRAKIYLRGGNGKRKGLLIIQSDLNQEQVRGLHESIKVLNEQQSGLYCMTLPLDVKWQYISL